MKCARNECGNVVARRHTGRPAKYCSEYCQDKQWTKDNRTMGRTRKIPVRANDENESKRQRRYYLRQYYLKNRITKTVARRKCALVGCNALSAVRTSPVGRYPIYCTPRCSKRAFIRKNARSRAEKERARYHRLTKEQRRRPNHKIISARRFRIGGVRVYVKASAEIDELGRMKMKIWDAIKQRTGGRK